MPGENTPRLLRLMLRLAAAVGILWLSLRFLLPWLAPFLLAFSLAAAMEGWVKSMVRHGWRRSIASGVLTLTVAAAVVALTVGLAARCITLATDLARRMPMLMSAAGLRLDNLALRLRTYAAAAPEGVSEYLETAIESVREVIYDVPAVISQWVLDAAAKAAQSTPDTLLFAVTAGIGTYFISAAFPKTLAFISAQLPSDFLHRLEGLGQDLRGSFGGFLRAQLILMVMTFFELLLTFLFLGIDKAAVIAAITALIDALPVFGTGVVLVPWAAYSLLIGETERGIVLLACTLAVNLLRNCIQAKLLGDQIGLDPIASLLSIYVGWRICGVWGMLLFPIGLVTLQQLNDKGVIRLWRSI